MADILNKIPVNDKMTIFKTEIEPIKLNACIDNILMRVNRLETKFADTQHVKHGRWIDCSYYDVCVRSEEQDIQFKCSNCEHRIYNKPDDDNLFCGHCGARMDLKDRDTNG